MGKKKRLYDKRKQIQTTLAGLRRLEKRLRQLPKEIGELGVLARQASIWCARAGFTCFAWIRKMMTLARITMVLFVFFVSLIFYYLYFPYKVIEVNEYPFPVLEESVEPGGSITILMDFTKNYDCVNPPEIQWFLVDGFVLQLADKGITRPIGQQSVVRTIYVPQSAPSNVEAHFRIEYACRVNTLRTISYSWDTETFFIK